MHVWPVARESSLALSVSLSRLMGGQPDVPTREALGLTFFLR